MEQFFRSGHDWIMKLPRSMHGVRFSNPDALIRDSDALNINIPDSDIKDFGKDTIEFYALSAYDGYPCVIIKTVNHSVQWCRGLDADRPLNYIKQVVEFIVTQNFGIDADMACTGLIRQKGRYYDVYNLPRGFIVRGNMDLSYSGLRSLPDMSTVVIQGNYDISGNRLERFNGAPCLVCGDFIVRNNELKKCLRLRPLGTKICGHFYNGHTK